MKKAVLITNFSWVGISTPVLNTAEYLIEYGWDVRLIAIGADQSKFKLPSTVKPYCVILNYKGIYKNIASNIFSIIKGIIELIYILRKELKGSSFVVAYDFGALLYFPFISFFGKTRILYYSLEFVEVCQGNQEWVSRIKKGIERFLSRKCYGVVTQDIVRRDYLRNDLRCDKIWIVPNSPRSELQNCRSRSFAKKLAIPDGKKILLCIGTLGHDTLIDRILLVVPELPDPYVIVLHGWFPDLDLRNKAYLYAAKFPDRLFISEELTEFDKKSFLYQAVDYVFVGFSKRNKNLELAVGAAGKFYDALHNACPVIAFESPGTKDLVEGNGVGEVIRDFSELESALKTIDGKNAKIQENCAKAHNFYRHDSWFAAVVEALDKPVFSSMQSGDDQFPHSEDTKTYLARFDYGHGLDIQALWAEMDRVWHTLGLDNRKPLLGQPINDFYRHPVWVLNGLFSETDPKSLAHRQAIAKYLGDIWDHISKLRIADFGGGSGALARQIAERFSSFASIEIIEPFPSEFFQQRLAGREEIAFRENFSPDGYDVVVAQDVLEHVEQPIELALQCIGATRMGGVVLFANCFHPVIACHLPKTFHLRHTFKYVIGTSSLVYIGSVPNASHVQVFRKVGEIDRSDVIRRARIASTLGPLLNVPVRLLALPKSWVTVTGAKP